MSWIGWPGKVLGSALLIGLVGLALAIWPATILDRGPSGEVRVSLFPLALTLLDPFVWTCVWNSLLIALLVSMGSMILGVGVGIAGSAGHFRGRGILWAISLLPLATGPLLVAPAIRLVLGGPQAMDWLAARSILAYPLDELVRWIALFWVGLSVGVPIVALATESAVRKLEPTWVDAAKLTGASPLRIWLEIVWPFVRPTVAEASGAVFLLTLVEPAAPLLLGLNRTLAVSIIDSATRLEQPTRAASLALLSVAIVAIVRTLIVWWAGTSLARPGMVATAAVERMSFRQATFCRLMMTGWVILGAGPLVLLILRTFQALQSATNGLTLDSVRLKFEDPELLTWISNSLTIASLALAIDLLVVRILFQPRPDSGRSSLDLCSRFLRGLPPLALGVGAIATPWLLSAAADSIGGILGEGIRRSTMELNPARSPGLLLILVVASGKLPLLVRLAELSRARVRPALIDASKLIGLTDRRASLEGQAGWLGFIPWRPALLLLALASTNLAPALLMTPISERRTIAPAIVLTLVREGTIDFRIAAAISIVSIIKVAAFAAASRSRVGSLGDWYRG